MCQCENVEMLVSNRFCEPVSPSPLVGGFGEQRKRNLIANNPDLSGCQCANESLIQGINMLILVSKGFSCKALNINYLYK